MRPEGRRAKVGGPKDRERGEVLGAQGVASPIPPARGSGERCKLPGGVRDGAPAAKGFSRILNTQDDLSGQQDYGPLSKRIKHKNK